MDNCRQMLLATVMAAVVAWSLAARAGELEDGIAAFEKHDFNTAVRLIEPLAEQGNIEAEYFMGTFHMYGHGVAMDPAQAAWYTARPKKQAPWPAGPARRQRPGIDESGITWGGSSAGRASRSQCEGREFDPPPLHHSLIRMAPNSAGNPHKN